jgi:sensor histidine kinase YesM
MEPNSVFNITVCLLGVLILSVHIVNILLKKKRRIDENRLLIFFVFTVVHFALYFTFAVVKEWFVSHEYIIGFYTVFYIMNNVEVLLFYFYMSSYMKIEPKIKKIVDIINLSLFAIFVITDIVNIFTRMYFTSIIFEGRVIYQRNQYMFISQGYQFVMLALCFVLVLFNKTINIREKIAFSLYCILPAVSIVVQNLFKGYAIAYLTMLVSTEILFLFLNVEKNIRIQEDAKKLKDADVMLMVSQIQPHFIYNTLSSISTLISLDPEKAQQALDEFTDYLRVNLSAISATKLVSFEDELKHIKTYVDLEKMRFNDRVRVIYDTPVIDFPVPPLSVQPLVENAIKHGILKKIEGGTVTLKTYENDEAYVVEINDDGVGFNMDEVDFKENKHIGLNNVKYRIETMCKGDVKFESEVNKGTKVVVQFYK